MCEVGLAWLEFSDGGEGFGNGHVRGVDLVAESIDDQEIEVLENWEGFFGNGFDVWKVSECAGIGVVKAISVGAHASVLDFEGGDFEPVEFEGSLKFSRFGADVSGLVVCEGKGPGIHASEAVEGFRRTVKWEGIFAVPTEGAEFIKTGDVVEVFVSIQDRIDGGEIFAKGLLTEVGTTVDEELPPGAFKKNGTS